MALVVNTNMASMDAINKLNGTQHSLTSTFERISSGLRINKAADDAAGLGVSEQFDAEYRGLRQASRNGNDGISLIQTAEGAANEVANIIKRMRELAVQSSSDTLGTDERSYIQTEYTQLSAEVERIAYVTKFNGVMLSTSSLTTVQVQVGNEHSTNDRINVTLGDLRANGLGVSTNQVNLQTTTAALAALSTLDVALTSVNSYRSTFGAVQNRLESAMRNLNTFTQNIASARSRIVDADFAYETAQMAKFQILQQSGVATLGQANAVNQAALRLIG
jgi:flagellin